MLNIPQLTYPCALPHKQLLDDGCDDIYTKMLPIIVQTHYFGSVYKQATRPIERKKQDFLLRINHFLEGQMHLHLETVNIEDDIFIVRLNFEKKTHFQDFDLIPPKIGFIKNSRNLTYLKWISYRHWMFREHSKVKYQLLNIFHGSKYFLQRNMCPCRTVNELIDLGLVLRACLIWYRRYNCTIAGEKFGDSAKQLT